ncbi:hypothetical protein SLS62_002605 [Diatrype stigma]|uniref:Glycerate kinase n=1 Tax=Diatrype stigma TaxID=117547 RepID=A0AAN9V8B4_9PEZI
MHQALDHYKKLLSTPFRSNSSNRSSSFEEASPVVDHHQPPARPQSQSQSQSRSQGLRILIAPSGFKESLEPEEVADCIEEGFRRVLPDDDDNDTAVLRKVPLHDGGEGFCKAIVALHGGELRSLRVTGPDRRPVDSHFGLIGADRKTAVIDMAAAAGLRLVPRDSDGRRDPTTTTTYGVGELIGAALDAGCNRVIVGCGDSGTSDAGAGMLQALGVRLLDRDGRELERAGGGGTLSELQTIALGDIHPRLRGGSSTEHVRIEAICNVKNILCGPSGVARVYGPQKGATPAQVEHLSRALERFASAARPLVDSNSKDGDIALRPGSGASGGLGAGLLLLGAQLCGRAEAMDEYFGWSTNGGGGLFGDDNDDGDEVPWDLVVTAEGSLDYQSARGKMTVEIARRAKSRGIPVLALAGTVGPGAEAVYEAGICSVVSVLDRPLSLDEAISDAKRLLVNGAERAMRTMLLGMALRCNHTMCNTTTTTPSLASTPTPRTPLQHHLIDDDVPVLKSTELDARTCGKLMQAL